MMSESGKKFVLAKPIELEIFKQAGTPDWEQVTNLEQEISITYEIPEEMLKKNVRYYIVRNHDGECTLLEDLDDEYTTITFKTDRFSVYALVYEKERCGLCGICPTLGNVCVFIWAGIAVVVCAAAAVTVVLLRRRKAVSK